MKKKKKNKFKLSVVQNKIIYRIRKEYSNNHERGSSWFRGVFNSLGSKYKVWLIATLWEMLSQIERKQCAKEIVKINTTGADSVVVVATTKKEQKGTVTRKGNPFQHLTATPADQLALIEANEKENKKHREEMREADKKAEEIRCQQELERLCIIYDENTEPEDYKIHQAFVTDYERRDHVFTLAKRMASIHTRSYQGMLEILPKKQAKGMVDWTQLFQEMPKCGIYRFYNSAGLSYIGESKDIWKRIQDHLKPKIILKSRQRHHQYIRQYGMEDFNVEVLWYGEDLTRDVVRKEFEAVFIKWFDSTNPEKGWNVVSPNSGARCNEDTAMTIITKRIEKGFIQNSVDLFIPQNAT